MVNYFLADFLECEALISSCRNYTTNVGTVVWIVDQIRIKQSTDGTVNVHGMLGDTRICLTTSPSEDVGLKFGDDLRGSCVSSFLSKSISMFYFAFAKDSSIHAQVSCRSS